MAQREALIWNRYRACPDGYAFSGFSKLRHLLAKGAIVPRNVKKTDDPAAVPEVWVISSKDHDRAAVSPMTLDQWLEAMQAFGLLEGHTTTSLVDLLNDGAAGAAILWRVIARNHDLDRSDRDHPLHAAPDDPRLPSHEPGRHG
jgi:hypothetical protein